MGTRLLGLVVMVWGAGAAATAQVSDFVHLPEGVHLPTVGYATVDSTTSAYDNSGDTHDKLQSTGFGPLFSGIYQTVTALNGGVPPLGPATTNFRAVHFRTRGEAYSAAYSYGISDQLSFTAVARFINVRTKIKGQTTNNDFFVLSNLVGLSGGDPVDDVHFNDELLTLDLNLANWSEEEDLGDGRTRKGAIVGGVTYRAGQAIGNDLLAFALTELGRMNRPPYLRLGYEGFIEDETSDVEVSYGAQLAYHFEGRTQQANPAKITNNAFINLTGLPNAPTPDIIESVRSDDHFGFLGHVEYKKGVGDGVKVGGGLSIEYEDGHDLRRVGFTGVPAFDANRITERKSEYRAYYSLLAEYDGVDAYQRGDASIPWVGQLEFRDSFAGRNQSKLQLLTFKLSVPMRREG